jgi:hypothetical protein
MSRALFDYQSLRQGQIVTLVAFGWTGWARVSENTPAGIECLVKTDRDAMRAMYFDPTGISRGTRRRHRQSAVQRDSRLHAGSAQRDPADASTNRHLHQPRNPRRVDARTADRGLMAARLERNSFPTGHFFIYKLQIVYCGFRNSQYIKKNAQPSSEEKELGV